MCRARTCIQRSGKCAINCDVDSIQGGPIKKVWIKSLVGRFNRRVIVPLIRTDYWRSYFEITARDVEFSY